MAQRERSGSEGAGALGTAHARYHIGRVQPAVQQARVLLEQIVHQLTGAKGNEGGGEEEEGT